MSSSSYSIPDSSGGLYHFKILSNINLRLLTAEFHVVFADRKVGSFRYYISLMKMFANAFLYTGNIFSCTRFRASSTPCIAMCLVTRSSNSDWHRSKASSINNCNGSSESSPLPSSSSASSSRTLISLSSVSALSLIFASSSSALSLALSSSMISGFSLSSIVSSSLKSALTASVFSEFPLSSIVSSSLKSAWTVLTC